MSFEHENIPDELLPLAGFGLPLLDSHQTGRLVELYRQGVTTIEEIEGIDQNLVEIAQGDLGLLITIGNRDILLMVATKYLDQSEDRENFFSEGLVKMHESWKSYDPTRGDPRQYFYKVAKHCAIDLYRGKENGGWEVSLDDLPDLERYSTGSAESDAFYNIRIGNIVKNGGIGGTLRYISEQAGMTPAEQNGFVAGGIRRAYRLHERQGAGQRLSRALRIGQNRGLKELKAHPNVVEDTLYEV